MKSVYVILKDLILSWKLHGICISVSLIISCEITSEIELDIPSKPPKLVINSNLVPWSIPGMKQLGIEISSTYHIFDTSEYKSVTDATVLLFKNGEFVDTIKYVDTLQNRPYPVDYAPFSGPLPGDTYSIEVSAPGYEKVYAKTTIPEKVEILDVSITPVGLIDDSIEIIVGGRRLGGGIWSEVTITFADPPHIENYYEIVVSPIHSFYESKKFYTLFTNESIITGESYYPSPMELHLKNPRQLLFNDRSFNGDTRTISFYYFPPQGWYINSYIEYHIINIQLRNITAEYYYHKTTLLQSLNNQEEDVLYGMREPLNVFTNIENGHGIFAGFNEDIFQAQIEETIVEQP